MLKKLILSSIILFGIQSTGLCAELSPELTSFKSCLEHRFTILQKVYYTFLETAYKYKYICDLENDATNYPEQTKKNISELLNNRKEILWFYLAKQRLSHIITCKDCLTYSYAAFCSQILTPNDIPHKCLNHILFEILSQTSNRPDKKIQTMTTDELRKLMFYMYSKTQFQINRFAELCKSDQQFNTELTQALSGSTVNMSSSFFEKYLSITTESGTPENNTQIPPSIKKIITFALGIFGDLRVALILTPSFIDVDRIIKVIRNQIAIAQKTQLEKQDCK